MANVTPAKKTPAPPVMKDKEKDNVQEKPVVQEDNSSEVNEDNSEIEKNSSDDSETLAVDSEGNPKNTTTKELVNNMVDGGEHKHVEVADVKPVASNMRTPGSISYETPEESAERHGITTTDVYQTPSSTHLHPDIVVDLQAQGKKLENPYDSFDFAPDAKFSDNAPNDSENKADVHYDRSLAGSVSDPVDAENKSDDKK